MISLPACPPNAFPDCTISVLAFFLLQIGGCALLFTRCSKRLDFEHNTWSTALSKISELQNHVKEGLGELAREREGRAIERDTNVLSLQAEVQELRGAISTLNKSKGEVEAQILEREVELLEREARWAKERDDLRKASEFTISKYAVESIAALNARLHAMKIECESKDAQVQSLAQAKSELEAARSKDLLEYMLLKQKEELEREHSLGTSKLITEITTLTAKLQATEMKCESKELQIRTVTQTKAGLEGENRQLEEKVLSLTDKLSEYRILLNEALSPVSAQYPTNFLPPPPPPPEYSGFEWGHKQTQSAVPSPSNSLGGLYAPRIINPDRYDRRHARKVRIRDPAEDETVKR
jgi:predicted nuclease with TOPRIM domain